MGSMGLMVMGKGQRMYYSGLALIRPSYRRKWARVQLLFIPGFAYLLQGGQTGLFRSDDNPGPWTQGGSVRSDHGADCLGIFIHKPFIFLNIKAKGFNMLLAAKGVFENGLVGQGGKGLAAAPPCFAFYFPEALGFLGAKGDRGCHVLDDTHADSCVLMGSCLLVHCVHTVTNVKEMPEQVPGKNCMTYFVVDD